MKFFRTCVLAAITALAFASCQKELNFDNGGVSFGTLKSVTTGDCLPSSINGIYKKDSVLTTNNFIDVQVSVSIPGTFDIRSDTINGCSFSKTGNVGYGLNTIRLYGSGKPVAAGTFTFTVKYDSSICKVSVIVLNGSGGTGGAIYAMGGAPGNCSGVTLGGTFTQLIAMTSANSAQMNVSVTGIGTYSIKTDTVNGVHFDASGSFSSTTPSPQLVTLRATGIPLAAGPFNYQVTAVGISPASQCTFSVTYIPPLPPAVFTLDGAPGACVPPTINGIYTAGVALTAANNIVINVTVTTAGTYSFSTDLQNGMKFTTAGVFTGTGPTTVTFLPVPGSTPVAAITTTLTPQVTTPACTIAIPVGAALDRIYKFNIGATVYTGPCSGLLLGMVPDQMSITGGVGTNLFGLTLNNQTGSIVTGNYSGTSLAGKYASFQYSEGFPTPTLILIGDPNLPVPLNTNLSAIITSLDMVNFVVEGTFSGSVRDGSGNLITITNGTFKADF